MYEEMAEFMKKVSAAVDGEELRVEERNLLDDERLEILDEERHVISFSVVDDEHRLANYWSVTTLHPGGGGMVVVESYVIDVPAGNTKEETCTFPDTIVRCNLQSLAKLAD